MTVDPIPALNSRNFRSPVLALRSPGRHGVHACEGESYWLERLTPMKFQFGTNRGEAQTKGTTHAGGEFSGRGFLRPGRLVSAGYVSALPSWGTA